MSCAGIFGSGSTKTVVMEHHRINESRDSPIHHTSNPVTEPTETVSDTWAKSGEMDSKNQKSKNSHGLIVRLGK